MGRNVTSHLFYVGAVAAVVLPLFLWWWRSWSKASRRQPLTRLGVHMKLEQIHVVDNVHQWEKIVPMLKKEIESNNVKALGFDCEWVTSDGIMHPVALLQLATPRGICVLMRLRALDTIPDSLTEILENRRILKLGVGCLDDATKLHRDYGLKVQGCLDLRNLAARLQCLPESCSSLSGLAESQLGATLDKTRRIRCSDWEASSLTEEQIIYAATDALVAVDIFRALLGNRWVTDVFEDASSGDKAKSLWQGLMDCKYKQTGATPRVDTGKIMSNCTHKSSPEKNKTYPSRTNFYHNCEIRAPDGELLCKTSRYKAEWYLKRNLGEPIGNNPLVVQLKFEPSRRPPSDNDFCIPDKQYTCVVCGCKEGLNRKYIVPKEYRKYIPKAVKDHKIHDVLLLCNPCHFRCERKDEELKAILVEKCNAPIESSNENRELVRIKGVARTLLRQNDHLPGGRRCEMWQQVRVYLGREEVNAQDLKVILDTKPRELANIHGKKVVEYYLSQGDISDFERTWRLHFLENMKPLHLPEAWSMEHTSRWPGLDSAPRENDSD